MEQLRADFAETSSYLIYDINSGRSMCCCSDIADNMTLRLERPSRIVAGLETENLIGCFVNTLVIRGDGGVETHGVMIFLVTYAT